MNSGIASNTEYRYLIQIQMKNMSRLSEESHYLAGILNLAVGVTFLTQHTENGMKWYQLDKRLE